MSDTAHATDDQLAQFAEGKLTGDAFDTVERHLDGCAPCRQLLAAVSNGSTPTMRPERATFSPGDVLGRYRIERLIAAGGMGMLYVALDPQLGRRVALKLMRPSVAAIEGGRVRLLREAQTMASLAHPNVVHVYELGEVEGRVFVAMELVEGGTLRDWMKKPSTWKEVVAIFCAAGEGLAAAHRAGVVHRDFKPENVLVGPDNRPRVTDFGLARPELVAEEELPLDAALPMHVTQTGTMLGTPAYMAPEQLAGKRADARSDQYGFCVSLYEALAGKRPFPADTLEELRTRVEGGMPAPPKDGLVPAHVWAAIARGLNPTPSHRFPDMESLLTVLRFEGKSKAAGSGLMRNRGMQIAAAIASLVVIGAGAVLAIRSQPTEPTAVVSPVPLAAPIPLAPPPIDDDLTAQHELAAAPHGHNPLTREVSVEVGAQQVFDIADLTRVAIGDEAIADVKIIGSTQLIVTGREQGRTTLVVWSGKGERTTSTIAVHPASRARSQNGNEPVVVLGTGMQAVLDIDGITRVAVGDPDVCDIKTVGDNQLLVIGTNPGKTTILVWKTSGERLSYLCDVHNALKP